MAARITPSAGVKSDKLWRDAIHRAVKRKREGKGGPQSLDRLADKLVDVALEGDVSALKEIGDRLDGKPTQAVDHGVQEGSRVKFIMSIGSDGGTDS